MRMKYPKTTPFNPMDKDYKPMIVYTPWAGYVVVNGFKEKEAMEAFVAQECRLVLKVILVSMFVITPLILIFISKYG